jgi:hypothetical protein
LAVLFTLALLPGGCFGETFQRGYVLPDGALEQIPSARRRRWRP